MNSGNPTLLSVRQLQVHFPLARAWPWQPRGVLQAVERVNLDLAAGETLGVVGESGCGKSTLARAITGLQAVTAGAIHINGQDVTRLDAAGWRRLRRQVQMVFQDPLASLNPRMTAGDIVAEPLRHLLPALTRRDRARKVDTMLDKVGLGRGLRNRYPHEFSGGQCQRIGIARALIVEPKVLICDEPVSALDVSIQAQILALLQALQAELGIGILFIAHDLAVVRQICHRVLVLYLGRVVETGTAEALFAAPGHPYTRALLSAVPRPDPASERRRQRIPLDGALPSATDPPSGCVFRSRCPWTQDLCGRETPRLRRATANSRAACHFAEDMVAAQPVPV